MQPEDGIQQELKQTRPFKTRAQAAAMSVLRTASEVHRVLDALVQREGIALQQYNVLRILRGAGGRLPTMEVAERLVEQTPGVTRLVDRLEEKGLLARERCTEDRRRVFCQITPAGLDVLARLDEPVDRLDEAGMALLTEEDLQRLLEMLQAVRNGFRQAADEASST